MTKRRQWLLFVLIFVVLAVGLAIYSRVRNSEPANRNYVALGDSIAAGAGLSGSTGECGRTGQAYPVMVAQKYKYNLRNLACSGAKTNALNAQVDQAFQFGPPHLVTITAGANDVGWADYIRLCYTSTCGTPTDTGDVDKMLGSLGQNLDKALVSIRDKGLIYLGIQGDDKVPEVVVTGYYNPFSASCLKLQSGIDAAELDWLNDSIDKLNQTLEDKTSKYSFAHFAEVDFNNHGICSANPWVQSLFSPAPFHPTVLGQQAIAEAIEKAL